MCEVTMQNMKESFGHNALIVRHFKLSWTDKKWKTILNLPKSFSFLSLLFLFL